MNVATITMDKEEAREKLRAYRADRHKDAEEVYRAAEAGYAALAAGTPLINLDQAIANGGFFDDMRPKLAVGRADRKEVYFQWNSHEERANFYSGSTRTSEWASLQTWVHMGRLHGITWGNGGGGRPVRGFALIPMVPADVRPATGQLKDWHILWEVEAWSDKSLTGQPPRDPFLIKHIGGSLWAVLAEWDLTELERAVMTQVVRR